MHAEEEANAQRLREHKIGQEDSNGWKNSSVDELRLQKGVENRKVCRCTKCQRGIERNRERAVMVDSPRGLWQRETVD